MKKFKNDATYSIKFKNDEAEELMFIHFKCLVVENANRVVIYHVMSLYEDVKRTGKAYGGFLEQIQEEDPEALKYIIITKL